MTQGFGKVNSKGLDFYKRLANELLERGIKPAATLYHWDLPQVLEDKGGWLNRDTSYRFRDYAAVVFEELGDIIDSWITLNEPWCSAFLGYGTGHHAPGIQDLKVHWQAGHHLLLGHGLALKAYRDLDLKQAIGITLNLTPQYPASDRPEDRKAVIKADGFQNRWYLDPVFKGEYPNDLIEALNLVNPHIQPGDMALISAPFDFLGINYYSRSIIGADEHGEPQAQRGSGSHTAMDWEVYPQGLYDLLVRVHQDYGPIPLYITENGAAYHDAWEQGQINDEERRRYLEEHFAVANKAIAAGVPLEGYFVWSLLDNFEWAFGYERRFGLIHVDFPTQKRSMKASAKWYQAFLAKQRQ